ncbi:extensin [Actinacidiphila sp. bgisy167]|uniref:extensin n=1 Tax=Actinacidiphila sp. bgisy167 TaxID=3413797 RepID=UPI003D71FDC9
MRQQQIAAREAIVLLRTMTRVLCVVGVMALAFTTVNVTRFATSRGVPWPIAALLDPMLATALAGVLFADARLASWGIRPPAWSTALRWSAGSTAALMNTWESLWPDRQIGWPHHADPAAVLLHLTPALLLIALTETIAAYRRTISTLSDTIGPTEPPAHGPEPALQDQPPALAREGADTVPDETRTGDATDHRAHAQIDVGQPDGDVWPRAVGLDDASRATTGKPVSIWKLRTELRIGPHRAQQIHDRLRARHNVRTPPATD